jgi:hypothetical protein
MTTATLKASSSTKVDRNAGIIRNVKLIGFESKNRRRYPPEVLRKAVHLYEGAKVNVDHPERDPTQPRKYGERVGAIRNARFVEGKGLYGDFYYNPKHAMAEQIAWDAQNNPEALGFSHNALLRMGPTRDGFEQVEEILNIRSMDLVSDPATTSSLFESFTISDKTGPMASAFRQLIVSVFDDDSLDTKTTLKKITDILKVQAQLMNDGSSEKAESEAEKMRILREKLSKVNKGLERYEAPRSLSQLRTDAELAKATLEHLDRRGHRQGSGTSRSFVGIPVPTPENKLRQFVNAITR